MSQHTYKTLGHIKLVIKMIPMWAWQGKEKKKKLATITNKTTTTDTHTVKLQLHKTKQNTATLCSLLP